MLQRCHCLFLSTCIAGRAAGLAVLQGVQDGMTGSVRKKESGGDGPGDALPGSPAGPCAGALAGRGILSCREPLPKGEEKG